MNDLYIYWQEKKNDKDGNVDKRNSKRYFVNYSTINKLSTDVSFLEFDDS